MMKSEKSNHGNNIRVTLLGTGGPPPVLERFGPATLVEAGGEILLFDAGRGVLQRLSQLQPPLKHVRNLFLTHLHSDHTIGLPDLWLTGWLHGRPQTPLRVWGPRGTVKMMEYLDRAYDFDVRIRLYDDQPPPAGVCVMAEDITEGLVYRHRGVEVTAITVDHSPIEPAFGYRIDYAGRSVVLSGDTRVCENLVSHAKGVDLLVHEVIADGIIRAQSKGNAESLERVIAHHTTPEQAGEIFTRIQPKLAVYSHIIPVNAQATDVIPPTRKTYLGPLELGEDLMVIDVGDEITVRRAHQRPSY